MPCERSAQRVDQANGYKPKTMLTRLGEITFDVPQVRTAGFYPSALERGSRSEQSVNLALAEMYVQGVSTRKVIEVLQKLVGPEVSISPTQISRCAQKLDVGLEAWRDRPLDDTPYVLLDARYERVREAGQVVDCAVLVAVGVTASSHRRVLGVSVALSEAEVHWQRCQFHLQHNAQGYVSRLDHRAPVARTIALIFNAPDVNEASRLLGLAVEAWGTTHPKLAEWAQLNIAEGFAVFGLPPGHRVRMRTTNGLERLNKEIKRRTRVATLFPNSASCLRLVSAILAEQDEEWMTAKIYLNMKL